MAGPNVWQEFKNRLFAVGNLLIGPISETFNSGKGLSTTDATVTTLKSYTPRDGKVVNMLVLITARKSDGSQGASYVRQACFRRAGATTTQIGATRTIGTDNEDDAAWDVTLDASSADVRVRVTGKAATTIAWSCVALVNFAP